MLNPRNYSKPIDMWAVGTIFGEMLARKPMFPAQNYDHLVRMQVRMLGSPSEVEMAWITREKAKNFLRSLPNAPKKELKG